MCLRELSNNTTHPSSQKSQVTYSLYQLSDNVQVSSLLKAMTQLTN